MKSVSLKRLFAHYTPYAEYAVNGSLFSEEDTLDYAGSYGYGLLDKLHKDPSKNYLIIDFHVHPHKDSFKKKFKQKFRTGINWEAVENNLINRVEAFLQKVTESAERIKVGIEGETDEGVLMCTAVIKEPKSSDISTLQYHLRKIMETDFHINYKCKDPNNKRYITMQVGDIEVSTLEGGCWPLVEWQYVASRMKDFDNDPTLLRNIL